MKFLIFGCNGMAGHMITLYLKEQGHDVTGFARNDSAFVNTIRGNAMEASCIRDVLGKNRYDTVINCVGILNQDAENHKADAVFLNSYFPHLLADLTDGTSTQVIHISTDCVFSGEKGQYTEDDFRDGFTFYDRSKALGELEDGKNLTLRQSVVGPDIKPSGLGLLNWFMQQKKEVYGYKSAIWTGQTSLQLAKTMEYASLNRVNGLYNTVPESCISKCELLCLFNKYLRAEKVSIIPIDQRRVDKSLKSMRWAFNYKIPDYEQMIAELADWMKAHKTLYPHYSL